MLIAQALLMAFNDMRLWRFPIDVKPFPVPATLPEVSDEQWREFASPMHFAWNLKTDKETRMKIKRLCRVKIPRKMKKALKSYDNNKDCRKTKRVMRIIRIERKVLKQLEQEKIGNIYDKSERNENQLLQRRRTS